MNYKGNLIKLKVVLYSIVLAKEKNVTHDFTKSVMGALIKFPPSFETQVPDKKCIFDCPFVSCTKH